MHSTNLKKVLLNVIFSLVMLPLRLYSQPETLWEKTYGGEQGDYGSSVEQTSDGGYIIIGTTSSFRNGSQDIWLIKTDVNGDTTWTKTFGGTEYDYGSSVKQTTDGGYIIIGGTSGSGNFDFWLIKTDVSGDTTWTKTFGRSESDFAHSVEQTTDGGYIIAGQTNSLGTTVADVWLIKTDANGDTAWTKTFGGTGYDSGYSVVQTTDGGYIIIGETQSYGAGNSDVWLIKTGINGDPSWTKTFGGTEHDCDCGRSVQQTTDGGYIIAGETSSSEAGLDVWLIKTGINGDPSWTKTFGGTEHDYGCSVEQTTDGGYIVGGYTFSFGAGNSDVWLIKTDVNGDTTWTKTFGGAEYDYGYIVEQTIDGGYIVGGYTESFEAGLDVLLIKTDVGPLMSLQNVRTTHGDKQIILNWDQTNLDIRKYNIYRDTQSPAATLIDSIIGNPPANTYIDTGLTNGVTYYYRIKSVDIYGVESNFSIEIYARPDVPPIWVNLPDTSFAEDDTLTMNLNEYLFDEYDLSSTLNIDITGGQNIHYSLEVVSHIILFFSDPDSSMITESFIFTATDSGGLSGSDTISLYVYPVNDPPVPTLSEITVTEGEITKIMLTAIAGPPNEVHQELTYTLASLPSFGYLLTDQESNPIAENELPLELSDPGIYFSSPEKFVETSFIYYVTDNGGTENGGIDTSEHQEVIITMSISEMFNISSNGLIEGGITIIGDNTLYAPSSGDKVYRFDTTGTVIYTLNVDGDIKSSTTITSNHNIYIASTDYNLYSFNSNGVTNPNWPIALGSQATASVAIDHAENIYIGTNNGIFQSMTPDGQVKWSYNIGGAVYASAAISDNNVLYIINISGRAYAFDLKTINPSAIEPIWIYEVSDSVISSPALDFENNIYIATKGGRIIKLQDNNTSVAVIWDISTEESFSASPVISSSNKIIIGGENKTLYAINTLNGEVIWQKTVKDKIMSTVALAEIGSELDRLYVGDDSGTLYSIALTSGNVFWQYNASSSIRCPILYANNHVYFGTISGDIFSIKDNFSSSSLTKSSLQQSNAIWPTFQGNNRRTGYQKDITVSISDNFIVTPCDFCLYPNFPNPFNPTTTIKYDIPERVKVTLTVYNTLGQVVDILVNQTKEPGFYTVNWDASKIGTGVYFFNIQAGGYNKVNKCILLK